MKMNISEPFKWSAHCRLKTQDKRSCSNKVYIFFCSELHEAQSSVPLPIKEYIKEVQSHLESLTAYSGPEVTLSDKLTFLRETRHAFGRTALVLSGGGALGAFHVVSISAKIFTVCSSLSYSDCEVVKSCSRELLSSSMTAKVILQRQSSCILSPSFCSISKFDSCVGGGQVLISAGFVAQSHLWQQCGINW